MSSDSGAAHLELDQLDQKNIEYWNGPGAQRWVRNREIIDRAFAAFGDAALARLAPAPGEAIVDVGCGGGSTSVRIARSVGAAGSVTGIDPSAPLLAQARALGSAIPNLSFVQADAARHVFAQRFDAAFSRFGVMFFADPVRAFGHLRTALVPGGRFVFACWQGFEENPWVSLPFAAVCPLLPDAQPPTGADQPGPFRFGNAGHLGGVLSRAGYQRVRIETLRAAVVFAEDGLEPALDFALQLGPVGRLLSEQSEALRSAAREQLRALLSPFCQRNGRVELEGAVWLVDARA